MGTFITVFRYELHIKIWKTIHEKLGEMVGYIIKSAKSWETKRKGVQRVTAFFILSVFWKDSDFDQILS